MELGDIHYRLGNATESRRCWQAVVDAWGDGAAKDLYQVQHCRRMLEQTCREPQ